MNRLFSRTFLTAIFILILCSVCVAAGSWSTNNFSYKPQLTTQGTTDYGNFNNSQDSVDSRLGKEIWVGDPLHLTLDSILADATVTSGTIVVPAGTHTLNASSNRTLASGLTLRALQGGIISIPTGRTLTINGVVEASYYQIFTGAGVVSFTSQRKIKTSWFGDTAAGINKALTSTPAHTGVICEIPDYIDLGTTSIVMELEGQTLQGQGNNFSGENSAGSVIKYSGTGYAIIIGKPGTFSSHATLKDFMLHGGGVGAKGIRIGFADPGWANYPCLDNITVMRFTGPGIEVYGSIYGVYKRVQASYNYGAGMVVGPTPGLLEGGNINRWESCSFSYNSQEGVLFKIGRDWSFVSSDMQGNGYEGFKVLGFGSDGVGNLVLENDWFEGNQTDAGRTTGYFHLLSPNTYPGLITIRNNNFRGITSPWNGTTGNKMMSVTAVKTVVESNSYAAFSMGAASPIEAITRTEPITYPGVTLVKLTAHGWATGDSILFYNITQTGGWLQRLNGVSFKITKIDVDYFTIPCDTTACVLDYVYNADSTIRKLNVPRPWNYCGGGVLHFVGEDPDKWGVQQQVKVLGDFGGWCYADYGTPSVIGRQTRTGGEEALYEHIIKGGTLSGNGEVIQDSNQWAPRFTKGSRLGRLHIRASGTKTGSAGNKTIKLYFGTQAIATIGPGNDTNAWVIDAYVQITDATVQRINTTTLNSSTLAAAYVDGTQNLANDCKVYVTGYVVDAADHVVCHSLSIVPQ